ncbi:MAG: zinc ribbon domain-containing protein [Acidobacteria bacterium]|nr:zinc ribbon domain-containing protein [Acidobacteriota bacterium]
MTSPGQPPLACPHCHIRPLPPGSQFCSHCGAPLNVPAPPAGPPPPPPPGGQPVPARGYPSAPPAGAAPYPRTGHPPPRCSTCGSDGGKLDEARLVCPECRWLRPLTPGYTLDCQAFQWAQDGAAMARLRSIAPLAKSARLISDRIGRRWIESTFSAVRLSDAQMPGVYGLAILAARIMGMPSMPDVYVSGERLWDCVTYGSETNSFVLIGTALVSNFRGDDLLFLLAREMGHCRAGHALWKTVIRFLLGEQGQRKGFFGSGGGVLSALNPVQLVSGTIELPLLAWARQAEITGDRAGLLAVGSEDVARRVLLSWCLKSLMLYRHVNIDAWMGQLDDADEQITRLSEFAYASTPYITRRLKLLAQFAGTPDLAHWWSVIAPLREAARDAVEWNPQRPPGAPPRREAARARPRAAPPPSPAGKPRDDFVRLVCPSCKSPLRVPRQVLAGKETFRVKCPTPDCGRIVVLKRNMAPAEAMPPDKLPRSVQEGWMDSD